MQLWCFACLFSPTKPLPPTLRKSSAPPRPAPPKLTPSTKPFPPKKPLPQLVNKGPRAKVCMHAVCVRVCMCVRARMYACVCVHIGACTYVFMYVCMCYNNVTIFYRHCTVTMVNIMMSWASTRVSPSSWSVKSVMSGTRYATYMIAPPTPLW